MSGTKMVWSVKLDPDTADELESIAESLGWTKQRLMQLMIDHFLASRSDLYYRLMEYDKNQMTEEEDE